VITPPGLLQVTFSPKGSPSLGVTLVPFSPLRCVQTPCLSVNRPPSLKHVSKAESLPPPKDAPSHTTTEVLDFLTLGFSPSLFVKPRKPKRRPILHHPHSPLEYVLPGSPLKKPMPPGCFSCPICRIFATPPPHLASLAPPPGQVCWAVVLHTQRPAPPLPSVSGILGTAGARSRGLPHVAQHLFSFEKKPPPPLAPPPPRPTVTLQLNQPGNAPNHPPLFAPQGGPPPPTHKNAVSPHLTLGQVPVNRFLVGEKIGFWCSFSPCLDLLPHLIRTVLNTLGIFPRPQTPGTLKNGRVKLVGHPPPNSVIPPPTTPILAKVGPERPPFSTLVIVEKSASIMGEGL